MKRRLALCLVVYAAALGPALAGEVRERTTFFMVHGKNFDELNQQLGMKGPDLGRGERHVGATDVAFKWDATYANVAGGCRVKQARVDLDLRMMLPRWSAPSASSRETRTLWKTLRDDIAAHEAQHSQIAKAWLKRIEAKVRALPVESDCAKMETRTNSEIRAMIKLHDAEQLAFDAAEAKRIDARIAHRIEEARSHAAR